MFSKHGPQGDADRQTAAALDRWDNEGGAAAGVLLESGRPACQQPDAFTSEAVRPRSAGSPSEP